MSKRIPKIDPEDRAAYEQGRTARRASIAREDAPHGDGDELEAWRKGWDFEDDACRPAAKKVDD